ncbi:hypothetical protein BG015_004650 [Linnemannia schmuckeri]|uniref:Uncharacterized protein n=1 Tax=Linnemannia schmuckeri TaxID=64567 RepID=A0A9P5S1K5_9FUNG|nr:hypothetical protein BG015_004650 [Linnemannia schmuckeri]
MTTDDQVVKRRRSSQPIVSLPSSSSSFFSSSSSRFPPTSPSSSPATMTTTLVTGPASGKTRFFKWKGRGSQHKVSCNDNNNSDDDDDKTVMSDSDDNDDGYSSDGASSLSATQEDTGVDDDEDKDGCATSTIGLADYDAGELETPIYSTARTPGTALRMLNGIGLDDGNSVASPPSPARSVSHGLPQKLTDYDGFQDAWAEINEMAVFEEDLEYAGLNESIEEFLTRMHERKRKSAFAGDGDFGEGPEYADAIWVPFEQPGFKHLNGDKTPTDDTDGNITPKARSSNSHKNDFRATHLIDMGSFVDYPSGDDYSDAEKIKVNKDVIRVSKKIDSDNPSTSCTDNYDSDSTAGWDNDDSDQETAKGGNTAGHELDGKNLESSDAIEATDKTGSITGSGHGAYDYEDEVDYGEDDDLFDSGVNLNATNMFLSASAAFCGHAALSCGAGETSV